MDDISTDQVKIQLDFLKKLDLFCIFKFIITNDIKIYNEKSYEVLIKIVNSYKIINIQESKNICFENNKVYIKFFCSSKNLFKKNKPKPNTHNQNFTSYKNENNNNITTGFSTCINSPYCLCGSSNLSNNYIHENDIEKKIENNFDIKNKRKNGLYSNDSMFSKDLCNTTLFKIFKFPKNEKVVDYIKNDLCLDAFIKEPLNINLCIVKFDKNNNKKKKRRKTRRIKNELMQSHTSVYNSDSEILNKPFRNSCNCHDIKSGQNQILSSSFISQNMTITTNSNITNNGTDLNTSENILNTKNTFTETDKSLSDFSEIPSTLKITELNSICNNNCNANTTNDLFYASCTMSESESVLNHYSDSVYVEHKELDTEDDSPKQFEKSVEASEKYDHNNYDQAYSQYFEKSFEKSFERSFERSFGKSSDKNFNTNYGDGVKNKLDSKREVVRQNSNNAKMKNQYTSFKLPKYNSNIFKKTNNNNNSSNIINSGNNTNSVSIVNNPYCDVTLCFSHFSQIHNILNRDPNGLRKIKMMLKKDIGTINISPFFINFDSTQIFKNICKSFKLTKYNYKERNIYDLINLCFSNSQSVDIVRTVFLNDLYKQELHKNENNNKKNYKKKHHKKRKKENILEILDEQKRVYVLYFINRFLYSQKTPLSNLFRNFKHNQIKQSEDMNMEDDPNYDELTIDYFIFLMIFENKIDQKFYKFIIKKIKDSKTTFSLTTSEKSQTPDFNTLIKPIDQKNEKLKNSNSYDQKQFLNEKRNSDILSNNSNTHTYIQDKFSDTNDALENTAKYGTTKYESSYTMHDEITKVEHTSSNYEYTLVNDSTFTSNTEMSLASQDSTCLNYKMQNEDIGYKTKNYKNQEDDGEDEEYEEEMKCVKNKTEIENEIILLKHIRPFPTIYWLVNKNICGYISHLEKVNIIKNIENLINQKNEKFNLLRHFLIYDHLKYIVIRLRHINKKILLFFYMFFLNSDIFLKQYQDNKNIEDITIGTYINPFQIQPDILNIFLQTYKIDTNTISEILRKINTLRIKGIGGILNFLTLKCLHLYFASHLSYPNTVGHILEEFFKS
ncbi:rhoptry protein RHOP148, putative [Plasmodium chabaudi adami]|uniref:Rhoptry protein RHOP148, putative n=1 Tax=Plasmodium chabaudi adami TaxID=5826 RepID=A0A1C6YHN8_PLACE|nr:rhoptry protein RHOP148, putative [Plasmodium chabaudi adami]